ncbi:MAG: GerMN domain-containing protein [Armatimonadota bacterium]
MSRGRPAPSRGSRAPVVFLLLVVIALSAALWRIYPEYKRLKAAGSKQQGAGSRSGPGPKADSQAPGAQTIATLYFARVIEGKLRMVPIRRDLPPGLGVARASLRELIEGAVPPGCERPLPAGTKLLGITVVDGLATADFTGQLVSGFRGGSDNEGVTVYAIVNTLTSLPGVERVRILVEGKPISTIGGHLETSAPLKYDGELVAQ